MISSKTLLALNTYIPSAYSSCEWKIIDYQKIQSAIPKKYKNKFLSYLYKIYFLYQQICFPRYGELAILIPSLNWQNKKIIVDSLVFLSRSKSKYIVDATNNKGNVTFFTLLKDLFYLILELITFPVLILETYLKIFYFSSLSPLQNELNIKHQRLAYLRTDPWLNIKAGGSVGHIAGVIKGFQSNGYKIDLFSSDKLGKIDFKQTNFIPILPSQIYSSFGCVDYLFYNYKFFRICKKHFQNQQYDFIYQRYSLGNFCGIFLKRKFKLPLILEYNGSEIWVSQHWGNGHQPFLKLFNKIEEINFKFAGLIVVISDALRKELISRGVSPQKILVNPNGVDPDKFNPQVDGSIIKKEYHLGNKIIIGFIGTFGKWHGVDLLAESIKSIISQNNNIHFLFIGDGELKPLVEQIIIKDNVQKYVILTGLIPQEEAPYYLATCDILVCPTLPNQDGSEFFGSPTKLFEYMAMGKAIVASRLGQIAEVLKDNQTALLVKAGDQKELTQAILKLAGNENLRKELGKNARQEIIKNYSWDKHVQKIVQAFCPLNKVNRNKTI